jgi:hypothetical protein
MVAMEGDVAVCTVRNVRRLAVRVEAVDAELEFGEDTAGGVGLAVVEARLYHLQSGSVSVGSSTGRTTGVRQVERQFRALEAI